MKILSLLTFSTLMLATLLKAELPTLKEELGTFALFDDRKARFKIKTDGKILIKPMKDRKTELYQGFDVLTLLQVREKGKEKWTTKQIKKDTLQPVGAPAVEPEEAVGYKVKVTGDSEYQIQVEQTKKGMLVKAWITDLGQRPKKKAEAEDAKPDAKKKPTKKTKTKEYEVRLVYGVRLNSLFYGLKESAAKDIIKKKTRGSDVRFVNLEKNREKFDFDEAAELKESGLEKGFKVLEIRSKALGKMRGLRVIPVNPDETTLEFIDYKGSKLFAGFTVGVVGPINQVGNAESGGILINYK